ncbi:HEPN domain-containing protein [Novosphingobium aquimarinum]|uniref:HEPN domain-containing protein n=1 Tax=Novosphingobium aquimarinum TaxID=2682494 RepID=UPI002FC30F6D
MGGGIARDGIALYEADDNDELARPKPKTPHAALQMAREYYEEWFPSAESFVRGYRYAFRDGDLKKAAFDLHQAAERFCHTVLLVLTFHSPHIHNLAFLRTQVERLDPRLQAVWPDDNRKQRGMFEKLKEAYVKARYAKHYRISEEELDWLSARVEDLARVVQAICLERIEQLEATAREAG